MENEKVSFFLLRNGKFFNKKDIKEVESIVSKINTDSIANLSVLRFRNPLFMSLLSLVLGIFGVDRFLLGDIKRGILKALTLPIQMIATIFLFKGLELQQNNVFFIEDVLGAGQINNIYLTTSTVLYSIFMLLFIYCVIDIFLIYSDTYEYNYRILVNFVGEGTKRRIITHKESEEVDDEDFYSDVTTAPLSKRKLSKSRTTNKRRKTSEESVVDLENKSKKK